MVAEDKSRGGFGEPAVHADAVTPSDNLLEGGLVTVSRGVWVGGAGDMKVITLGGETVTFVGIQAGTLLPLRIVHVYSTGTTATSILALY